MHLGAVSITDYLRLTGALQLPLEFEPGSKYHYSNPGYSLAGYIVEKVRCAVKPSASIYIGVLQAWFKHGAVLHLMWHQYDTMWHAWDGM
jgi:hypothetical protein